MPEYKIEKDKDLTALNSFGIKARAKRYVEPESEEALAAYLGNEGYDADKDLILGGGSNILFSRDVEGTLIRPMMKQLQTVREDDEHVWLRAGAGIDWDELVAHTVNNGWCGLENLSLIPGQVGASPIQNIGAYGREVKDVIENVECIEIASGKKLVLSNPECRFGYRDSIFKRELKGKAVISHLVFRLGRNAGYELSYGGLMNELEKYDQVNLKNIRQAVIDIRRAKLPDPEEVGNAGSFFKNPVVGQSKADDLKAQYPDMPLYPAGEGQSKLAAGWLIDQCGWKGRNIGHAGVHHRQALVLVNLGGATGVEIIELSKRIIRDVEERFGVRLEREVNLY